MSEMKWAALLACGGKINLGSVDVYYLGGLLIRGVDVQRGARVDRQNGDLSGVLGGDPHVGYGLGVAPKTA